MGEAYLRRAVSCQHKCDCATIKQRFRTETRHSMFFFQLSTMKIHLTTGTYSTAQ